MPVLKGGFFNCSLKESTESRDLKRASRLFQNVLHEKKWLQISVVQGPIVLKTF